jgi:phosphohistidine phosphatase
MARQLWLLRHGEAEPHGSRPDAERRLTQRGEEQSRAAGEALAALGLTFQAVFASPKVRAWDTAVLACEALGVAPEEHAPLAGDFDGRDALALLRATGEDERLLLVGHNPDMEQIPADLGAGRIEMKKGGIAGLRLEGGGAYVISVLRPREIARICSR